MAGSFSGPMKPTTPESSGVDAVLIHFFPGGHAVLPSPRWQPEIRRSPVWYMVKIPLENKVLRYIPGGCLGFLKHLTMQYHAKKTTSTLKMKYETFNLNIWFIGWWFRFSHPVGKKMLVKLDYLTIFPARGENKRYLKPPPMYSYDLELGKIYLKNQLWVQYFFPS